MPHRKRSSLLIFPTVGFIFGLVYAVMVIHGLVVTWHFVGNPSEKIARIIGFVSGYKLFVETESGDYYSLEYHPGANDTYAGSVQWVKETERAVEPLPERKPRLKFISWPLLVKVKQVYAMQFPGVEGEYLAKFALSQDGNLWLWNYGQGGLAVLFYLIYPALGLFYGLVLTLLNQAGVSVWRFIKDR